MDDLNTPLTAAPAKRRLGLPISAPWVLAGTLGLLLAAFVGWAVLVEDPLGGEPGATASIPVPLAKPPGGNPRPSPDAPLSSAAAPPDGRIITIIDGTSGKRQEIVIPGISEQQEPGDGLDGKSFEGSRHGPRFSGD